MMNDKENSSKMHRVISFSELKYAVYYYATAEDAVFILTRVCSEVSRAVTRVSSKLVRYKIYITDKLMLCDTL